jgi:hypothetical protein
MEPAIVVAIAALIVSLVNSAFTAKTYKKNRRLEFLQRKDRLAQSISVLSAANAESHMISARVSLVAVRNAGLALQGDHAQHNTTLNARLHKLQVGVEDGMRGWDENIANLRSISRALTSDNDAPEVERLIALTQEATDDLKKYNEGYSAVLKILETSSELIKTNLSDLDAKLRQITSDTEMMTQAQRQFVTEMKALTSARDGDA